MKENYPKPILDFSLKYEGGYSNHPRDPGGATFQGVTQRVYNTYRRNKHRPTQDVRAMATFERDEIYRHGYWDEVKGDALPSGVDLMLFDIAVNMGVGRAAQFAAKTEGLSALARIDKLDKLRMGFWKSLKRMWPVFGKGWTAREVACVRLAKRLAQEADKHVSA
jgi:lysozyme family protein